ncbi:MAG TPA: alpha/beta fold hydrolase, partial [Gemmatimonadaceae bacterium]
MSEPIDNDRRRFVGSAIMTLAAARFGMNTREAGTGSREAKRGATMTEGYGMTKPSGDMFDSIKQIDAGVLNVGYAEAGPANGPPVILLHGWPYDIHAFEEVAPILAAKGYRVIIPYLRGYGTTRFLSDDTMRNGEQAALAVDAIALMDALKIQKAIVGGFDWGSRTAGIMAALWPERIKGLVAVSGYIAVNLQANLQPLPPKA